MTEIIPHIGFREIMILKNTIIPLLNYLKLEVCLLKHELKMHHKLGSQIWVQTSLMMKSNDGLYINFTRSGFDQLFAYEFRFDDKT
jgi:hypothetical protein